MTPNKSYEKLKRLYLTGDVQGFLKKYSALENADDQIQFLAAKAFQAFGNWEAAEQIFATIKTRGTAENKIKAALRLDCLTFILKKQSRTFAKEVVDRCDQIGLEYPDGELFYFSQMTKIRVEAGLITLGLASADGKNKLIDKGLELFVKYDSGNHEDTIDLFNTLISHCVSVPLSRPQQAIELFEKYITQAKHPSNDSSPWLSPSLLVLAEAKLKANFFNQDHLTKSVLPEPLDQIRKQLSDLGHLCAEALVHSLYGSHLLNLDLIEGIEWIEKSLDKLWKLGYKKKVQNYLNQCLNWTEERAQPKVASRLLEQFGSYKKKEQTAIEEDLRQLHLSHDYFLKGDYLAGKNTLQEYLAATENESNKVHFVSLMVNSAGKLETDTRYLLDILEEQIDLLKGVGKSVLLAQLFSFQAIIKKNNADESYQQAIDMFSEIGIAEEVVNQWKNRFLAAIQLRLQKGLTPLIKEEHLTYLQEAENILKKDQWIKHPQLAVGNLYQAVGNALFFSGLHAEAIIELERADTCFTEASHLNASAINTNYWVLSLIEIGRKERNLASFDRAIELGEKALDILENSSLVDFVWRMQFHLGLALYEPLPRGLVPPQDVEVRQFRASQYFSQSLNTFGLIFRATSTLDTSNRLKAISQLNREIRQLIFTGFYHYFFQENWEMCIQWLEENRSKSLLASISNHLKPQENSKHKLVKEHQTLKALFLSSTKILEQRKLEAKMDTLYEKMATVPALHDYAIKMQQKIPAYEDLIEILRTEEKELEGKKLFFLYYYTHQNNVYAFGIGAELEKPLFQKITVESPDLEKELNEHYRAHMKKFPGTKPADTFWTRYSSLIAPLADWTKKGDLIYIVPYSFLHDLPFHALLVDGQPLIMRNPVCYNNSLTTWAYLNSKPKPGKEARKATVFGKPGDDLKASSTEADFVAKQLGTRAIKGEEVTKQALLEGLRTSDVLHFAGHGSFEKWSGFLSAISLHDKETLTAEEIMNEKIIGELIVLSACDTGLHINYPGNEQVGLVPAFLSAGASSVMASLWPVIDEEANQFFELFYAKLSTGRPKIIALQETMIDMMELDGYDHFYHWGSFILYGNWK